MDKKPDWLYRQSATVPLWLEDGELKIILVTSIKSGKWIVPKGVIERHLSPQESAANEALEEAGLLGEVEEQAIGYYEYRKWGGVCKVQVFALRVEKVLDEWQEMALRRRAIVPLAQALKLVENKDLAAIIERYAAVNMI